MFESSFWILPRQGENSLKYSRGMTGRTMKEWYTQQVRSLPTGDGMPAGGVARGCSLEEIL